LEKVKIWILDPDPEQLLCYGKEESKERWEREWVEDSVEKV
jgi:hypothetical protein